MVSTIEMPKIRETNLKNVIKIKGKQTKNVNKIKFGIFISDI
jgi:hypothetical protein